MIGPGSEVRREVELPGAPEDVWPAIADPDRLAEWFGAEAAGELREGARVEFRFRDGTSRAASIEDWEPPRRFAFRWAPFERALDGRARQRKPTRVELELSPEGDRTRLTVVERRLEGAVA